jgi:hypothetical protein
VSATLASLLARVRVVLMNSGAAAQPWEETVLAEAVRQAVAEYQLAGAGAVTLSGLDGAAETSLDGLHESLIVWGAGGYAALSRAVLRAESFQLGSEAGQLSAWGTARLAEFRLMLAAVFPTYQPALPAADAARLADLRAAQSAPWGTWADT